MCSWRRAPWALGTWGAVGDGPLVPWRPCPHRRSFVPALGCPGTEPCAVHSLDTSAARLWVPPGAVRLLILSFGEFPLGQAFNLRLERMLSGQWGPGQEPSEQWQRALPACPGSEPRALCCRCRYSAASAPVSTFPPGERPLRTDEGVVDEAGAEGRRLCAC